MTSHSLNLTWSQNNDADFERYEVYVSSEASLLGNLFVSYENSSFTGAFIFGLEPSRAYFFVVRVGSVVGAFAASNQVTATTLPASGETYETQPNPTDQSPNMVILAILVSLIIVAVAVRFGMSQSRP